MRKYVVFILCVLCAINVFAKKERWDERRDDWTPLMRAIYYNQTALRDSLIYTGVDVNEKSKRGGMTALTVAIKKQLIESVKVLLETNHITNVNEYIFTACSEQDADIVKLLIEYGANPDSVQQNGYTPLMAAVSFGSIEIVELLLESKVNINQQRTVDGMTALMLATYGGHIEKIKLLLRFRADKNILNKNGQRAYDDIDYVISIGRISKEEGEELRVLLRPSPNDGSNIELQPYKYNGKELDNMHGLNWYDFHARTLAMDIPVFGQMDPLCEKYYSVSPYAYCLNNPINRIDPDGRADFAVNKSFLFWNTTKIIGNDGIDDGRLLVLKTTKTSFESETDRVDGAGLSKSDLKATVNFIKQNSGNTEAFQNNGMAYDNSIAIESSADNRQAMINEVSRDNGRGGTADANNREYGGSIQNGAVVTAVPGAVSNPSVQQNASIDLPVGYPTFHSHPSGTRSEAVSGGTRNSWFNQFPSSVDVGNAGGHVNYVFGRSDKKVYVYTSGGVQAVIPIKYFVTPKR